VVKHEGSAEHDPLGCSDDRSAQPRSCEVSECNSRALLSFVSAQRIYAIRSDKSHGPGEGRVLDVL
jgi:hypothetical protein